MTFMDNEGNYEEAVRALAADKDVVAAMSADPINDQDIELAISGAVHKGLIDKEYNEPEKKSKLAKLIKAQGFKKTTGGGPAGLQTLTGGTTPENSEEVIKLATDLQKSGRAVTAKDIEKYNKITGSNIDTNNADALYQALAVTGKSLNIGKNIKDTTSTTSSEFGRAWDVYSQKLETQKKQKGLQEGLDTGAMDFGDMNKDISTLAGAVEGGAMKVIIVEDRKPGWFGGSPAKTELPDKTRATGNGL